MRKSEVVGGGVWAVWAVAVRPEWTAVLLMLSPFVLLPLGLRLAARAEAGPEAPTLNRLAQLSLIPALIGAASFLPQAGILAAALSAPWLIFTIGVAVSGAGRLLSRRSLRDPGVAVDVGLLFLVVGGGWLTISRAGLNPLGFSDAIVRLTAVHFHYAGFALPIVAGFTASRLNSSMLVPLGVIVGVPLTAFGIVAGGWLEWFGATAMAVAGIATAGLLVRLAIHHVGIARWLVGTAGIALFGGMGLALYWSWSVRFGWYFLGLENMAAFHGSLNALGFGLLGLVGLNLLPAADRVEPYAMSLHLRPVSGETLEHLTARAKGHETTNPVGLLNLPTPAGCKRNVWRRNVEHGDFAAAAEAIRQWRGHDAAEIVRSPAQPNVIVGETLALAIPVGPFAVSATCRVVDVIDEANRYGFTYSTLPHHPVDGEESFVVTRGDDGTIEVVVTAVWRPATIANHICPPLTRWLQNRAINQYLDGIATFELQGDPADGLNCWAGAEGGT